MSRGRRGSAGAAVRAGDVPGREAPRARRGRGGALGRVVRAGVARRKVQTLVMVLSTMMAVTATVLAGALLTASRAPFEHAFAQQNGAHLALQIDGSKASAAQVAATAHLPGVIASGGPYPQVTIDHGTGDAGQFGTMDLPPLTVVERPGPGGPLDDLALTSGRWATAPGEIVLSSDFFGPQPTLGMKLSFPDLSGGAVLTVVGAAKSVTGTADGWVVPGQIAALRPGAAAPAYQMLYRFAAAGTDAQVNADRAAVAARLPGAAVTGALSWLTAKLNAERGNAPFVPFIVAFGVLGLVMAVIIIGNVVSGAVGASLRRIGVLKALGFTPAQVVRAYIAQALIPSAFGIGFGVLFGNLLAVPLLRKTDLVIGTASLSVAAWVDIAAPVGVVALVALTAFAPALRAGRLRAVDAIAIGRSPTAGRGRTVRRLLGRAPLPRAFSLGLGAPFARPGRALAVAAAVVFGATAVTFALGLVSSFQQIQVGLSRDGASQVSVDFAGGRGGKSVMHVAPVGGAPAAPDPATVAAAIAAQPGTRSYYGVGSTQAAVSGLSGATTVRLLQGSAAAYSSPIISGSWFTGPDQAVVPTRFLQATGASVGSTITLTDNGVKVPVRIVGEVFYLREGGTDVITDLRTLSAVDPSAHVGNYEVKLKPGTDPAQYVRSLNKVLHPVGADAQDNALDRHDSTLPILDGLIAILTAMLATVAGLAVLNAAVLETRERVHDLGVYKSVGMTPRQTITLVLGSVVLIGLIGGAVGVPAGVAVHRYVLPVMAHAAATNVPQSYLAVYGHTEMVLLGLGGPAIAILGALLPASWAARTRTATALRTE
ncbi:FtsX-like permease family protein [Actinocrinis puniceicyclus]|uniref:FtsX-like permease family protein n=1 Tax=Actinocrinis puniceicyclus TaxID=977794 RepID=A0A8J7WNQ7_9ACTN|nr:FtsX-like permease family protein [Actinocrinis puniceicyclus]MBS2963164.1 FtsX-like permease family protein [Actinocrinis puniceicyclus]